MHAWNILCIFHEQMLTCKKCADGVQQILKHTNYPHSLGGTKAPPSLFLSAHLQARYWMMPDIFWWCDVLIRDEWVVFSVIVTWFIAIKLTITNDKAPWICRKTGKPENVCSQGETHLVRRWEVQAARDHRIRVGQHSFCMLVVSKNALTMLTFCTLDCFAMCLSGGTGAAQTQQNDQWCSSVLKSIWHQCPLFVALMARGLSCAILRVMCCKERVMLTVGWYRERSLCFVHWPPPVRTWR